MPTRDPVHQRAVARVAILARWRAPDDPELIAARRSLEVARAEARITQAVACAPPLTPEQAGRLLARLLLAEPAEAELTAPGVD